MKTLAHLRLSRLAAGALLALLVGEFAAPSVVHAECGDYVVFGSKRANGGGHSGPLVPATAMPHFTDDLPLVPVDHRTPCSGPTCSRGSRSPFVPVSAAPPAPEHWGCLTTVPAPTKPEGRPDRFEEGLLQSLERAFLIYHPPR